MDLSTGPAPKASMGLGPGTVWAWDLGAVQLGLGPGPVWAWDLGAVQLVFAISSYLGVNYLFMFC